MYAELIERSWAEQNFNQLLSIAKRLKDADLRQFPAHQLTYLGVACALKGELRLALPPLWHAYAKDPQNADTRLNVANCLKDLKDYRGARDVYLGSTHIQQDHLLMLGAAICDMEIGENLEALMILEKAVEKSPNDHDVQYQYGRILFRFERLKEAMAAYQKALELNPKHEPSAQNFAITALKAGDVNLGLGMVEQLFQAGAHNEHLLVSIMSVAMEAGVPQFGLHYYDVNEKPMSPRADFVAGEVARFMKDMQRCADLCEKTIAQDPKFAAAYIIRALSLAELGQYDLADEAINAFRSEIALEEIPAEKVPNPWASFAVLDDPSLQCKLAKRHADQIYNVLPREKVHVGRSSGKTLGVGYLSADFADHPVAECMMPVLAEKIEDVEVHIFSVRRHKDEVTQRVMDLVPNFHDCADLGYREILDEVKRREIGCMVDLTVYTSGGRPNYFALGLAQKQFNFLGYSGTSGARGYDFIIADEFIVPERQDVHYSEKVIRLSEPLMGCSLRDTRPIASKSREEYTLPEGAFVFGCLAQHYKYTKPIVSSWAQILNAVPGSVLLLAPAPDQTRSAIQKIFEAAGIERERIFFGKREPTREDHIARLKMVDLFLDTYPYNAHSLAADAISAGVPLLTLAGKSFASRVAGSILWYLKQDDGLIAATPEEYVASAVYLGNNPAITAGRRHQIEQAVASKNWGATYANDLYRKMRLA